MKAQPAEMTDHISTGLALKLSHATLNFKTATTNSRTGDIVVIPSQSMIWDYVPALADYVELITLSEKEYNHYYMKPKMFCNDVYGTTELWSIILRLNKMTSIVEFNKSEFYIYNSNQIKTVLNNIIIAEKKNIIINNAAVKEAME